jgi:hypothetical protein
MGFVATVDVTGQLSLDLCVDFATDEDGKTGQV